jgi:hypothetical protein
MARPVSRWPWEGDSPLARAHIIANQLLDELAQLDRDRALRRVRLAHEWGETWLGASLVSYADTDTVTTSEAAQLLGVSVNTIRKWAHMPHPDPRQAAHGRRLLRNTGQRRGHQTTYLVGELRRAADDYNAELARRAKRRRAGHQSSGSA